MSKRKKKGFDMVGVVRDVRFCDLPGVDYDRATEQQKSLLANASGRDELCRLNVLVHSKKICRVIFLFGCRQAR